MDDGCKTVHSSPLDYETKNIVSSSDGVSCAEKDETIITDMNSVFLTKWQTLSFRNLRKIRKSRRQLE